MPYVLEKVTVAILCMFSVVCLCVLTACEKQKEPAPVLSETAQLSTLQVNDETDLTAQTEQIIPETPERWEWVATYTGFFGKIVQPEFSSYINIYRSEQETSARYEVFVNDVLYSSGKFDPAQLSTSVEGVATTIEFPHDIYTSPNVPRRIHSMNTLLTLSHDTIAFSVEAQDCYYYFYAKTTKN